MRHEKRPDEFGYRLALSMVVFGTFLILCGEVLRRTAPVLEQKV